MNYKNLYRVVEDLSGLTLLESDVLEILHAYEEDLRQNGINLKSRNQIVDKICDLDFEMERLQNLKSELKTLEDYHGCHTLLLNIITLRARIETLKWVIE